MAKTKVRIARRSFLQGSGAAFALATSAGSVGARVAQAAALADITPHLAMLAARFRPMVFGHRAVNSMVHVGGPLHLSIMPWENTVSYQNELWSCIGDAFLFLDVLKYGPDSEKIMQALLDDVRCSPHMLSREYEISIMREELKSTSLPQIFHKTLRQWSARIAGHYEALKPNQKTELKNIDLLKFTTNGRTYRWGQAFNPKQLPDVIESIYVHTYGHRSNIMTVSADVDSALNALLKTSDIRARHMLRFMTNEEPAFYTPQRMQAFGLNDEDLARAFKIWIGDKEQIFRQQRLIEFKKNYLRGARYDRDAEIAYALTDYCQLNGLTWPAWCSPVALPEDLEPQRILDAERHNSAFPYRVYMIETDNRKAQAATQYFNRKLPANYATWTADADYDPTGAKNMMVIYEPCDAHILERVGKCGHAISSIEQESVQKIESCLAKWRTISDGAVTLADRLGRARDFINKNSVAHHKIHVQQSALARRLNLF